MEYTERLLKPSEVMRILGISYATFYRYVAQCRTCGKYLGKCECEHPITRMKCIDITPEGSMIKVRRVNSTELNKFLTGLEERGRS